MKLLVSIGVLLGLFICHLTGEFLFFKSRELHFNILIEALSDTLQRKFSLYIKNMWWWSNKSLMCGCTDAYHHSSCVWIMCDSPRRDADASTAEHLFFSDCVWTKTTLCHDEFQTLQTQRVCYVCCVCVCEKRSVIIFEEGAGYPAALWEKSSVFLTWIPSLYLGSLGMFGNVNFFLSLPPSQRPESSQKEVLCINNTSSFRLCNKLKIAPILVTVLRLFCSSAALDPWRKSLEMY